MPTSPEELIQRAVHAIETGDLVVWVRRVLLTLTILVIVVIYMYNFHGLTTSQGMDQAQIGRSIASGHGWRTGFARPRAVAQLRAHGKDPAQGAWIDTYNAPLPPLIDAIALFPFKSHLSMGRDTVYSGDKIIALMSIAIFFASVAILFFLVRRLFDQRLALLVCGLMLICEMFWRYATSGLPQMLLLFLFNATLYVFVRATEEKNRGGMVGPWLIALGAGFGLLALTHALTIWIFLAALIFCVFFFRPRGWAAAIVLAAFLVVYTPWLVRNTIVCGNPGGIAIYTVLDGIVHSESGWMRQMTLDIAGIGPAALRDKMVNNLISQTGRILDYLGWIVVALTFFVSLLHPFKRQEANAVRLLLLSMWGGAALGMAAYGIIEEQGVAANQLHLLFVPLMTCFGLAYLLVQWNRLGFVLPLARVAFLTGLFLLCGFPMMSSIFGMVLGSAKSIYVWPPYLPPAISYLTSWMGPNEIVASDMPWAVSWYADRRSVLLPDTIKNFTDLGDYKMLGGPINGLYLTPVSGSENKLGDILRGEYREWAPAIQRSGKIDNFPFQYGTVLGDPSCLFMSDRDRQKAPPSP